MDLFIYFVFRSFVALLDLLPYAARLRAVMTILRIFTLVSPAHVGVARKNLALAFPEKKDAEREAILTDSYRELARLICDSLRLRSVSDEWIMEHIIFKDAEAVNAAIARGRGLLICTGHLGSFELLARSFRVLCGPVYFVVRSFRSPRIDAWWNGIRQAHGNSIIRREGAFRKMVRELRAGHSVAIPFDQNVRREHAVFVDWFGRPAATTRALGLAAGLARCPILVISISFVAGRYYIATTLLDFEALYQDTSISDQARAQQITQRVSNEYEKMIRANPSGWFWMHRRWKTTPKGVPEDFYHGNT